MFSSLYVSATNCDLNVKCPQIGQNYFGQVKQGQRFFCPMVSHPCWTTI